jgi:hypothetical protein
MSSGDRDLPGSDETISWSGENILKQTAGITVAT